MMNELSPVITLGENLIFIVGCPRSGTTYLRRLISSLPQIQSGPESHLFDHVGPFMDLWHGYLATRERDGDSAVGLPLYFTHEEFVDIARKLVSELMKPMLQPLKEGEFFLEKSPTHALHLHTIHELLPKARIIHILRDPRDVVASLLAVSKNWSWAPSKSSEAAQVWCDYVNQVKKTAPLLADGTLFELRYESLIDRPTESLLAIANFLGMDWSPESIRNAIQTNSIEATRAKLGKHSVRRGQYNGWKQDLSWFDKFQVWQVAHSTMATVGYNWNVPW